MKIDHLPRVVQDGLRYRRGKNREMAIEIADALLPILRKHQPRIEDPYVFAGMTTATARDCIDAVRAGDLPANSR